jgi:uncharacterized membrane protein
VRPHLFWAAVALAAAVAANAAFTLFVPGWWFSRTVAKLAAANGVNSFFILDDTQQAQLFPGLPRAGVTGVCLFDLTQGDVTFSANLPDGYWITTIYTDKAEPIYSVNNRQSGADMFNVSLSKAPSFVEKILQSTQKETAEIDTGWTVQSPEAKGLAVVWYPVAEPGLKSMAARAVARSRCAVTPKNSQGTD